MFADYFRQYPFVQGLGSLFGKKTKMGFVLNRRKKSLSLKRARRSHKMRVQQIFSFLGKKMGFVGIPFPA